MRHVKHKGRVLARKQRLPVNIWLLSGEVLISDARAYVTRRNATEGQNYRVFSGTNELI